MPCKQKRIWPADDMVQRQQPAQLDQLRAWPGLLRKRSLLEEKHWEHQFHASADGLRITFLNVIDEHKALRLAKLVSRRCKGQNVGPMLTSASDAHPVE